jgi:hypothetical protein
VPAQALAWPATERYADVLKGRAQPLRPPGVARDHFRDLLSKGSPWTAAIGAPEATYLEVQHDDLASDRLIGNAAGIAAVHAPRATTTARAASRPKVVAHGDVHLPLGDQDTFDPQWLEMREQASDAQQVTPGARTAQRAQRRKGLPERLPGARN